MNFIAAFLTLLFSTIWASEVSPQNSHAEYPRPQMVRQNWINLNGLWEYAVSEKDSDSMPNAEGQILVPFCIESSLSGVGRRVSENESVWYRTTIEMPGDWAGKRVLLNFDAVDWKADVFIDGIMIGTHTGGFTAFSFDITDYIQSGPAELVVRVWDPTDDPEYSIPHGKQVNNPENIWYTPVTGIWQTVWMEAVPESYIEDYNVVSSSDGTVKVDVDVHGDADAVKIEVFKPEIGYDAVRHNHSVITSGKSTIRVGDTAKIRIRRPKFWSPDLPWLYGLRIRLIKNGKTVDTVYGYTTLRTISEATDEAGVKRLALNDEILFQLGPLDQGWWPDGLYTAPTNEALEWDILETKNLGFNMIRKHIKVEPSNWYYACDRLGMLVWQDMPSIGYYGGGRGKWGQGDDFYNSGRECSVTDSQKDNYYKEWREIITQLNKFHSIVIWVPFNEDWGQFDTQAVVDFTWALDSTRLINAASGGNWIKGAGDILDSHHYPNPNMRILDPEMINVLGEYGGIGCPIEGHTWEIDRKWGYIQYDTEDKVTDEYCLYARDLVDLKQLDWCAAAVYTQFTDVEGEVNGFYTYDRKVLKVKKDLVRDANEKIINSPNVPENSLIRPSAFHYKNSEKGIKSYLKFYTLRNAGITMQVTNYGGSIVSLSLGDKNIVRGHPDAEGYVLDSDEESLGSAFERLAGKVLTVKERTDSSIVFSDSTYKLEYSLKEDKSLVIQAEYISDQNEGSVEPLSLHPINGLSAKPVDNPDALNRLTYNF